MDDAVSIAVNKSAIYMGEVLLANKNLLLPSVCDFFLDNLRDIAIASNITFNKPTTTSRWILGHLIYTFEHHLSCKCKLRKHGTIILYRNGGIYLCL